MGRAARWLRGGTIGARLALTLTAAGAATAIMAVALVQLLFLATQSAQQLADTLLPSVRALEEIAGSTARYRAAEMAQLAATTPDANGGRGIGDGAGAGDDRDLSGGLREVARLQGRARRLQRVHGAVGVVPAGAFPRRRAGRQRPDGQGAGRAGHERRAAVREDAASAGHAGDAQRGVGGAGARPEPDDLPPRALLGLRRAHRLRAGRRRVGLPHDSQYKWDAARRGVRPRRGRRASAHHGARGCRFGPLTLARRERAGRVARGDVGVDGRNGVDDAPERAAYPDRRPVDERGRLTRAPTPTRCLPRWSGR